VFLSVDVRSTENPAPTPTPSSAGTQPEVEFDPTHQAVLVYKVIVDVANVYTEPDTTSSVIETANMDQVVEVLNMQEDWLLVTYLIGTVRTTGWMELSGLEIVR
ncbi:MAG: SH3 domain-containing protein, partial [Anaerolineales bacterium]|nr:SH3 domain-containing protein [Anaerolineales bacterium]